MVVGSASFNMLSSGLRPHNRYNQLPHTFMYPFGAFLLRRSLAKLLNIFVDEFYMSISFDTRYIYSLVGSALIVY